MDVSIRVAGKELVYLDAAFSVGLSVLVDRITSTGAIVKVNEYFATGDLWIFRMVPNSTGDMVRQNMEIFPAGTWTSAKILEPEKKKARKQSVH